MNIRRLFWKLWHPYEVKITCELIKEFINSSGAWLCKQCIENEAVKLAQDNPEKTIYSIRADHMKADELALILLFNVLTSELESGSNHVYRGMLSMHGMDMLKLWHFVTQKMLERGYLTEDGYKTDLEGLTRRITEMG